MLVNVDCTLLNTQLLLPNATSTTRGMNQRLSIVVTTDAKKKSTNGNKESTVTTSRH